MNFQISQCLTRVPGDLLDGSSHGMVRNGENLSYSHTVPGRNLYIPLIQGLAKSLFEAMD